MTPKLFRRLRQTGIALALAGTTVLVTHWAYPAGHLAIQVGAPHYSRMVGDTAPYVSIDLTLSNVGIEPVRIDAEHFLLEDETGRRYHRDPETHFLQSHADTLLLPLAHTIQATTVFKLSPGHRAAWLVFVTSTGRTVRFRLQ